jgi:hypothetical protein
MIDNVAITNVNDGGAPNALITLKNFGQTPAKNVTHWAKLVFSTFPEPTRPLPGRAPNEALPESAMAPSGTLRLITGIDIPLNTVIMGALGAQTNALYLRGEVRYVDAFGAKRETDFLLFCTGHLVPTGTVASHQTGNRIT